MNENLAYLLGAYFGDGHIYYIHSSYQFSLTSYDIDLCEKVSSISCEFFNSSGRITKNKKRDYYKVVICSKELCDYVLSFFCDVDFYTANKLDKKSKIPDCKQFNKFFIMGLMDTDGWISKRKNGKYIKFEIGFKNTSKLSNQIYKLMQNNGLKCGKFCQRQNTRYGVKNANSFSWNINAMSFYHNCGFGIKRKQELMQEYAIKKNIQL